ncbi:hypothetical protein BOQ63_002170 (plasmid) [Streptomyces viridifaciens]|nr:hypothetical protein BOQ63_002170 [Streptomyces viridifaciens]
MTAARNPAHGAADLAAAITTAMAATAGGCALVALDGRAGAGKPRLADRMAETLGGGGEVAVVHLKKVQYCPHLIDGCLSQAGLA